MVLKQGDKALISNLLNKKLYEVEIVKVKEDGLYVVKDEYGEEMTTNIIFPLGTKFEDTFLATY